MDNSEAAWTRVWSRIIQPLGPLSVHWRKVTSSIAGYIHDGDSEDLDALTQTEDEFLSSTMTIRAHFLTAEEQIIELGKKHKKQKSIDDLNITTFSEKEIAGSMAEDDDKRGEWLGNFIIPFVRRFEQLRNLDDLKVKEAIGLQQHVIEATNYMLPNYDYTPSHLNDLGILLQSRFEQFGKAADIDQAILLIKQAINLTPNGHVDKPVYLDNIGKLFQKRFERFGRVADINQAIVMLQQAVNITPKEHTNRPSRLNNLGTSLHRRFERFGEVADINQAILFKQQSVSLTPNGHPDQPGHLSNLGNSLHKRFKWFGEPSDINQAISVQQQAINLTPDEHANKPVYLNNLGTSFLCRFEQFGNVADIDQATRLKQRAVDLTPDGHASKPDRLINLGNSLQRRFKRFGKVADINQAILVQKQAIDLTPNDHADRASRLNNLGISFQRRFEWFGEIMDINLATSFKWNAVNLTPDGHACKPNRLNSLGVSFQSRFEWFGEVADIDKAISFKQQSVDLTPNDHANKPGRLSNLGNSFQKRFERLREVADINQAILVQRQAVYLTPSNHADKPSRLSNLGNSFHRRFEYFGNIADINQAIFFKREAVKLTPNNHPDKPGRLSNLGNSFQRRFERLGEVTDINRAILVQRQAVDLTPNRHADRPSRLNNLGLALQHRFKHLNQFVDINQAISVQQQAVDLTPDGHAEKSSRLQSLGHSLSAQFSRTSSINHLQCAIYAYSAAALSSTGSPRVRLESAREWALLSINSSLPNSDSRTEFSSLRACHVLMELVPRVVWFGNSISLRYHDITSVGNSVNIAVSIACSLNRPELAFEWLEQGRSIVWGQILRLRTPMDDLKRDYPKLAASMEVLSSRIELLSAGADDNPPAPLSTGTFHDTYTSRSLEKNAQEHRRLAEEWDNLLLQVRRCPGYKRFLQPKTIKELSPAAKSGPIVCVNIEKNRCDALILQKTDRDYQLEHLQLRQASLDKIKTVYGFFSQYLGSDSFKARSCDLEHLESKIKIIGESANDRSSHPVYPHGGMAEALEILWNIIVEPVVQKLGYTPSSSSDIGHTLPHVTWCATGLLAFLPLHAAGRYHSSNHTSKTANDRVYNYIVSSYTSSISALIKPKDADPHAFHGLAAVSLPFTADHSMSPLSGTRDEVAGIKDQFSDSDFTWLDGSASTKATVLEEMKKSSWLHLACHGVQRKDDPMESAFELYDGPLNLYTISRQNLPNARLAFLSACQTAAGDKDIPCEAAHLAAGMLMIGYHSVIGTMWSIKDQDAPLVSEEFYKYLVARKMKTEDSEAAYALHEAVGNLRKKIGEKEFARWVPFIHLGI